MPGVFIKTLGCKVNTFDSEVIVKQFLDKGYHLVESNAEADITVLNTCSVTKNAEKEARYLLRRFQREKPDAVRIVTGCYAQINSKQISELAEVDFVMPNETKENLVDFVVKNSGSLKNRADKFPVDLKPVEENKQGHFKSSLTLFDQPHVERTRAFLKIQDGCNNFCAYCQIPYARGASRSVPKEEVLQALRKMDQQGVREVVLTGIHLGDYGRDLPGEEALLVPLLTEMLAEVKNIGRIRLSSLEPGEVSEDLIKLYHSNSIFCPHFHLPLQSGSDAILKLMGRSYDKKEYRESVEMIRSYLPDVQISCDVIPGFPGETEEHFQETCDFIQSLNISSLHVFPYSKRPNTRALRMPGHLPVPVISERAQVLREISKSQWRKFSASFIGTQHFVLWENQVDTFGRVKGKTKNGLQVVMQGALEDLKNQITHVELKGLVDDATLLAVPVKS